MGLFDFLQPSAEYMDAYSRTASPQFGKYLDEREAQRQQQMYAKQLTQQAGSMFDPVEQQVKDPLAKALVHMSSQMAQSGNPILMEDLPKLINQMHGKLYQTVDPTDLMKNFSAAGIDVRDPANRDLMLQAILKPQMQTQINMGRPAPPAGYKYAAPDSEDMTYVTGGPADPNQKPMTDSEGKALSFYDTASAANELFSKLDGNIKHGSIDLKHELENIPLVGNVAGMVVNSSMSPEQQQADNAQRAFINAIVRSQTGADAKDSEIENLRKIYFADSSAKPEVKKQMSDLREIVLKSLYKQSGQHLRTEPKKTYKDYKKPADTKKPNVASAAPEQAITDSKTINGKNYYKVDGRWMTED